MKDRFKFRAWFKPKYREPIMLYQVEQTYDFMRGEPENVPKDCFGDVLADDNYIVMQCTGLKDKSGKLIYEGDIVKNFHVSSSMQGRVFIGYVVYDDTRCRFHIQEDKHCGYITFSDTDDIFEVIGNIYENPELLEVQNADNE